MTMGKRDLIHIIKPERLVVGRYMTVTQWSPKTGSYSGTYDRETDTWDPAPPCPVV